MEEGPRAAELRLSEDLRPLWYNLSIQVYVPGFIEIPEDKNLTFEAALILKFHVVKPTKIIQLNALKLNFNSPLSSYEILKDETEVIKEKVIF